MSTMQRRRHVTGAESAKALTAVQTLFDLTPAEKARARFDRCKREYDESTRALMAQEPGASERADAALLELNEAREALRAYGEEQR